ncbi:hypothetical protein EDB87DRAFT_1571407, partial [Lactarius vividus]
LGRLSKDWNSTVYAFFKPLPTVEHIDHHHVHVFECRALHCKGKGKYPRYILVDSRDGQHTHSDKADCGEIH